MNRQRYHVVASVNGNVYTAWQARVCYYWYKKAREQDTAGVMGGFTRLLHRSACLALSKAAPLASVPGPPVPCMLLGRCGCLFPRQISYTAWCQLFPALPLPLFVRRPSAR